jgi:hypothetical protein
MSKIIKQNNLLLTAYVNVYLACHELDFVLGAIKRLQKMVDKMSDYSTIWFENDKRIPL